MDKFIQVDLTRLNDDDYIEGLLTTYEEMQKNYEENLITEYVGKIKDLSMQLHNIDDQLNFHRTEVDDYKDNIENAKGNPAITENRQKLRSTYTTIEFLKDYKHQLLNDFLNFVKKGISDKEKDSLMSVYLHLIVTTGQELQKLSKRKLIPANPEEIKELEYIKELFEKKVTNLIDIQDTSILKDWLKEKYINIEDISALDYERLENIIHEYAK